MMTFYWLRTGYASTVLSLEPKVAGLEGQVPF